MTITESDAAATTTAPSVTTAVQPQGLYELITTGDHTTLGRLYVLVSAVFILGAGVLGVLSGAEKLDTTSIDLFGGVTSAWQTFAAYRIGLLLCGVLPLFIGLATAVVPLQVGSPAIAFPRAAAAAFWVWLLGVGLLIGGFAADGGLGEAPGLTEGTHQDGVALTLLAIGVLVVALLLAAVCVATTVLTLRAPGLTLRRVPVFSWSMLVASSVWFLTLPVLLGRILLAYVDYTHAQTLYGAESALYNQIRWSFGQPMIYAYAIPALGIVSEIIPVAARARQRSYDVVLGAIALFGLLSVGSFASAPNVQDKFVFLAVGYAIALPVLALFGAWADTLRQGKPASSGPLGALGLALLGALVLFGGVLAGVMYVFVPFDLRNTSAVDGQMAIVLLASATVGFAGVVYWSSKLTGRAVPEGLARLAVLPLVGGALLAGLGDFAAGFYDQPAGLVTSAVKDGAEIMNAIGLVGYGLFALGALVAVGAVVRTFLPSGSYAPANPWQGHTLEWASSSPPPVGNFRGPLPVVRSERPLLDAAENGGAV